MTGAADIISAFESHPMRAVMCAQVAFALLLGARVGGRHLRAMSCGTKVTVVGFAGVLFYLFLGFVKAVILGVRFDWVSAVGVVALTVVIVGESMRVRETNRSGRS